MAIPAYMKQGRSVANSEQHRPHRNRTRKGRRYRFRFVWKDGVGGGVPQHADLTHCKVELIKVTIADGSQAILEASGHTGLTWRRRDMGEAVRYVAAITYTVQNDWAVNDNTERIILRATATDGADPIWRNQGQGWPWLRSTFVF
jgi:hypothetical protein